MEDQLRINRKSIRHILLGDYGKRKICVKIYHELRRMISFCRDSEALAENRDVPKIIHPFDSPEPAAATSREWRRSRLSHLECFSMTIKENVTA
jgi:hypothetical protein